MSRTMFKYPLAGWVRETVITNHQVEMPRGARIRHVGIQQNQVTMWAEVDQDEAPETRSFAIRGTGHEIQEMEVYLGTVFADPYVWHLFETSR